MCGRYFLERRFTSLETAREFQHAERVAERLSVHMKTEGEIRPTDTAPVIAPSREGRRPDAFPMRWGFEHPTRGMLVFNTRSETAHEKAMFADSINERRCLIPASRYFEWKKNEEGRKERYAFFAEDGGPLLIAGLYVRPPQGLILPCFTILTRDADRSIRALHPRMPVLVPETRAEEWLSGREDLLLAIRELDVPVAAERA